jgi:exopolysaccharide biosynthesis protein
MRKTDNENHSKKPKKRRFSKPIIAVTVILQLAAAAFICLALVIYGPFATVRTSIIGAAMTSYKHQYIAKMFFSQAQIDAVMNSAAKNSTSGTKESSVKATKIGDNGMTLENISSSSYNGYLLTISDPTRVKLAVTKYLGKMGENTSDMAIENNAVAAINAGGFANSASGGTGDHATDFIIQNGVLKDVQTDKDQKCFVIAFDSKGTLVVGSYSINELLARSNKITSAVTMPSMPGYALVAEGVGAFKSSSSSSVYSFAPRTAIGQKSDGSVIMLVLDGRRLNMKGASLYDVQKIMLDHGAVTAANLDGGNSSVMYYNGSVINNPSGEYGERTVATSFYVESSGS